MTTLFRQTQGDESEADPYPYSTSCSRLKRKEFQRPFFLLCRDEQGRIGTSTGLNAGHGRRSGEEMKGGAWHGRMASVGRVRDRWLTSTFPSCLVPGCARPCRRPCPAREQRAQATACRVACYEQNCLLGYKITNTSMYVVRTAWLK